jgi:WD40 repeat protein
LDPWLENPPDGRVLTGCEDHKARLWDVATGKLLGPPLAHQGSVQAVAFSPDGRTLLTGSHDQTARLWDAATAKPLGPPWRTPCKSWPWLLAPTAKPF